MRQNKPYSKVLFFRVALMYHSCCQGKLGELAKKQLTKPTVLFILSLSKC